MDRQPVTLAETRGIGGVAALAIGVLAIATGIAAWQLRFLCDDAYITFRYVANAHDGLGLVWNAPPFQPVEGYTSFLWALLLWATWSWSGVEPPAAANVLSLGCGLLLFGVCAHAAMRLRGREGERLPAIVGLVTLAVLAGNRTFLQWMTGGLETALFNLGFASWVLLAFRRRERRGLAWLSGWSAVAVVVALTRPDGLLLVAATGATGLLLAAARRLSPRQVVIGLLPLMAVGAHLLWRHSFYGEWLPNTYYAKVTAPWPEAGWRYSYCFAFEHGVWLWPVVAVVALVVALRRGRASPRALLTDHLPATAAVAATLFHVGYYLIRVGADHFEYRVLSHIVPLGTLATAVMAARIGRGAWLPAGTMVLLGIASSVTWVHLALTPPRVYPDYSAFGDHLPAWLRPFVREFDRNAAWLQMHFCFRTGELEIWVERQRQVLPARARMQVDPNDIPIVKTIAVGYLGWVLPDIAVLDELGLNDWVAARTPTTQWYLPFLPRAELERAIDGADLDLDGTLTRAELEHTFAAMSGGTREMVRTFVDRLFLLFAGDVDDGLSRREVVDMRRFFAELRFIAHERRAPEGYVAALDPNVTIVDRTVVVRARALPLTAERLRSIETEWRQRLGAAPRPR